MRSVYIDEDDDMMTVMGGAAVLTPMQRKAADEVLNGITRAGVLLLRGKAGMGKSTVLREVQSTSHGAFVSGRELAQMLAQRPASAIEQTIRGVFERAMRTSDAVVVDDLHVISAAAQKYGPQSTSFENTMQAALSEAEVLNKRFVFAVSGESVYPAIQLRAVAHDLVDFTPEDFGWICANYLGPAAELLDFGKIHRFAPALTVYELKNACLWLGLRDAEPDTEAFIEYVSASGFTTRNSRVASA